MYKNASRVLMLACSLALWGTALASGDVHWAYSGEAGPDRWGTLDEAYSVCASGRNQSPIDLSGMVDGALSAVQVAYKPGGQEVVNNGHAVQVNYAAGSSMTVDGHEFALKQFHFHSPSENTINGRSFPMEAHFVHADDAGNLAVISVMFEEGAANAELEKAWQHMPAKAGGKMALPAMVDGAKVLPAERAYYRFNGSLTTPPCSEGVLWLVMKQVNSASKTQLEKFSKTMGHPNNRPVQPINARLVVE